MNVTLSGFQHAPSDYQAELLRGGEVVVVVDDDPLIREPLRLFFEDKGLPTLEAGSAAECFALLESRPVALVLLDLGLPDLPGLEVLALIRERYPLLAVIMLTGSTDLQTALDCLRRGADDYLTKPVRLEEILLAVRKNLEKRRLVIQNRQYQFDLENANFRIQLMHQLSLKMNSVYLSSVELDEILQAILVGITANEGLRFNRAFLALVDHETQTLQGRLAIGPGCREEAGRVWEELNRKRLDFSDLVKDANLCRANGGQGLNRLIQGLSVPMSDTGHLLVRAALERRSLNVVAGKVEGFEPGGMVELLGADSFVVVPLFSPRRALGVIIADNFVTRQEISESHVSALELFSSQASLVIEHTRLHLNMQKTIAELEAVNHELDKNKDLLIEAERFSALGHMASQMLHTLQNPITSIGGLARLMAKKTQDQEMANYADLVYREASRLEVTLADLFDFVTHTEFNLEPTRLSPLLHKVLLLMQPDINKRKITVQTVVPDPELTLELDAAQISKMLVHLLKNAIEAMPEGGRLTIELVREAPWLKIIITDSGKGIDDEQLRRAREPFYTTKSYGTGMGLAMVERIVAAHQGHFVINRKSVGTEVMVLLPLSQTR
ncbi:MAG: response regulator [Desulfobacteraceae bacterium]|nr:response regulator [Desulfobacteraceae bacterium]